MLIELHAETKHENRIKSDGFNCQHFNCRQLNSVIVYKSTNALIIYSCICDKIKQYLG